LYAAALLLPAASALAPPAALAQTPARSGATAAGEALPMPDASSCGQVTQGGRIMKPDVVYTVIFLKDKKYLASPTVLGEFGREVRVEVPNEMRVLACSAAPNQEGRSFTSAKMFLFKDDAWQEVKEMTMEARLDMTPSFEYSVPDTAYRFVVMQRMIVPAASEASSIASDP
jgi:hypothetical protein